VNNPIEKSFGKHEVPNVIRFGIFTRKVATLGAERVVSMITSSCRKSPRAKPMRTEEKYKMAVLPANLTIFSAFPGLVDSFLRHSANSFPWPPSTLPQKTTLRP